MRESVRRCGIPSATADLQILPAALGATAPGRRRGRSHVTACAVTSGVTRDSGASHQQLNNSSPSHPSAIQLLPYEVASAYCDTDHICFTRRLDQP